MDDESDGGFDGDSDYNYDSGNDDGGGETAEFAIGGVKLFRENSSGTPYFHVPIDTYVIQSGDEKSVLPLLRGLVAEVAAYLGICEDESLSLLRICGYSKEKVYDRYFSDRVAFRKEAGISHLGEPLGAMGDLRDIQCQICFDEVPAAEVFALGCGHQFCCSCFRSHIKANIDDGLSSIAPPCPSFRCKETCTDSVMKRILSDPCDHQYLERYEKFLVTHFVSSTAFIRYCPAPNCGRISVGSGVTTVSCDCGVVYCFLCGNEAHDPCSCEHLRQWTIKGNSENESLTWILANTQRCPNAKCNFSIEKNQGCNHMTCSQCRHEFCWICLKDWRDHGGSFYKCNKFEESADSDDNSPEAQRRRAKRESDRYLHYFRRFESHDSSRKHALTMLNTFRQGTSKMSTQTSLEIPITQFISACEMLVSSRKVLMNTYILGFYLTDGSREKELFEHQQALLEETAEHLQELAKFPTKIRDKDDVRRQTEVLGHFLRNLTSTFIGGIVRNFDVTA